MTTSARQIKLGAFFKLPGHHLASWRYPGVDPAKSFQLPYLAQLAQTAERGKFDMIFFADRLGLSDNFKKTEGALNLQLDPLTLLPALAAVTRHIGLAGTLSSTYNEPYHAARKFASLDLLSGGRSAWNVVTSFASSEAKNFNRSDHLAHDLRYARGREFVQVVKGLWDCWEDDALIYDQHSGKYADPDKIRSLDHQGEWFSVRGPLNLPRSPQGQSVLIQAGVSESGKELAAETADIVFTAWPSREAAAGFYRDLKSRLAKYGRKPEQLLVMPGVSPLIGRTPREVAEKQHALEQLIQPEVGVALLSDLVNFDVSPYPLDLLLTDVPGLRAFKEGTGRHRLVMQEAERDGLTIRQAYIRFASARGHMPIAGTPEQIADQLQLWFESGAADGFNIMPPVLPESLDDFVELVVPILQQRGLFRSEYTGSTLRENLGL